MLEKLLQPNTLKLFFILTISLFMISLIYWIYTNTKAARLHLQNEQTVAQKLEAGELQITIDNPSNDSK